MCGHTHTLPICLDLSTAGTKEIHILSSHCLALFLSYLFCSLFTSFSHLLSASSGFFHRKMVWEIRGLSCCILLSQQCFAGYALDMPWNEPTVAICVWNNLSENGHAFWNLWFPNFWLWFDLAIFKLYYSLVHICQESCSRLREKSWERDLGQMDIAQKHMWSSSVSSDQGWKSCALWQFLSVRRLHRKLTIN